MGVGDAETLYRVQDKLFKSIRAADAHYVIVVEDGYKGMLSLPDPEKYGWKNVV